jgi:hypothetical protein
MRSPSARALQSCAAAVFCAGCAIAAAGCAVAAVDEYHGPTTGGVPTSANSSTVDTPAILAPHVHADGQRDEPTGDIFPDRPVLDAGTAAAQDGAAPSAAPDAEITNEADAGAHTSLALSDAAVASTSKRCQRGARSLTSLMVNGQVSYTVLMDDTYVYYQNALPESSMRLRQDIMALPRAVLYDPSLPVTPVIILHDDYAIDSLVSGDDGFLYFIAMPMADGTNQGMFRVEKHERAAIESLPIHALAADDYWPGQLAMDESYFYLASIGASSRSLRIVRVARVGYQREELWLDTSASNDDNAIGSTTLEQADIALDRDHVYFTERVNHNGAPHAYRVFRLDKQGHHQTPVLLTTIDNTYGGLASDGTHLFFSNNGSLEQWDLMTQAHETLLPQEGMLDLSYVDGVISWTPTSVGGGNLDFFCL